MTPTFEDIARNASFAQGAEIDHDERHTLSSGGNGTLFIYRRITTTSASGRPVAGKVLIATIRLLNSDEWLLTREGDRRNGPDRMTDRSLRFATAAQAVAAAD